MFHLIVHDVITVIVVAVGFCSCDLNIDNGRGMYNWPEAMAGQTVSQMCQYGIAGQNITRYCNKNLTWTEVASLCPTVVTNEFNQLNTAIKNVLGRV